MTKATKVLLAVDNKFEMTPAVETYLQEQIDFLSQLACNQLGTIANYANISGFQTIPTFEQMFGNDFGLASDSNQRELKYAASTVANSPDMLVQVKPTGNVYGTQDAEGVKDTVFSDADRNKIQLSEFGYKVVSETAERFAKTMTDVSMLHSHFGIVPTTIAARSATSCSLLTSTPRSALSKRCNLAQKASLLKTSSITSAFFHW